MTLKKVPDQVVTFHDPCNLGRLGGEYEAPRKILKAVDGIELKEMGRNRDTSWCCGAGGGVLTAFPDFAVSTAEERVDEAEESGADTLISSCPFCEYNLKNGIRNRKSDLKIMDISEIVYEAMNIGQ